jgi:molybdate transport system substrate-binding protein
MPKAQLKILSAGAVKRGVAAIAASFGESSGHTVEVEFATAPVVRERLLKGETPDVVVLPPRQLDDVDRAGRVASGTRSFIGRSRMGVIVQTGATLPDLASAESFKAAVLETSQLVYNQASSGIYVDGLLERLGIANEVRAKVTKVANGGAVMEQVARATVPALGIGQLSEIKVHIERGLAVVLAGPLPAAIQNETAYEACVAQASGEHAAATELVRALTSEAGKRVFAATGIE